jgi:hypothetical protein
VEKQQPKVLLLSLAQLQLVLVRKQQVLLDELMLQHLRDEFFRRFLFQ